MAIDLIFGLAFLLAIIVCVIIYLVIVNILKFIVSFRFMARLIEDFRRQRRKYIQSGAIKRWQPWKYG